MTNLSGKFETPVSNIETETTVQDISKQIPPAPSVSVLQRVEEYFGKCWWAWIILLLIIKIRTK